MWSSQTDVFGFLRQLALAKAISLGDAQISKAWFTSRVHVKTLSRQGGSGSWAA